MEPRAPYFRPRSRLGQPIHAIPQRRRPAQPVTGRDGDTRYTRSNPDDFQRRIHAVAADARPATRGKRGHPARRRAGAAPRHGSPPVPVEQRRHVGRVPRHEHRVRSRLQRLARRGRHAGHGRGSRAKACGPVHLRLPDSFRARRLWPGGNHRPRAVRQAVLEPGAREREVARPHEVRQLRERDLRRQRHQGGDAVGLTGGRSIQPVPDQRPDHRGAHRGQFASRARAACWRIPSSSP